MFVIDLVLEMISLGYISLPLTVFASSLVKDNSEHFEQVHNSMIEY